jgi:acetyl-CoA decarbonylase/synthase complex subunit gamma
MGKTRPLLYAATPENWKEIAELALMYDCPAVASGKGDLNTLNSVASTLLEYGVEEIVLDPGTIPGHGIGQTLSNFTMLRRAACEEGNRALGFPLMGTPISVWLEGEGEPEVSKWEEAYLTSMLITRYADLLIVHSIDGWVILPNLVWRQNLYTDPRKPVAVDPALKAFGNPDPTSPLLCTTNFALTYYTVASDIEAAGISCYLLVVDTEGISVESAVAGRKLTADKVAESIKAFKVSEKVSHRTMIIPGRAARLSGEIEDATGWKVIVGPVDSSGIPKFLQEKWKT